MRLTKVQFTMIDDTENEKVTTIIEYGPFDSDGKHPVEALIEHLDNINKEEDDSCQTTKIIT